VLQQHAPVLWKTAFKLDMRRIPFDCQQRIVFFIIDNVPLFHHAKFDARGNGQSHAEAALQRYGGARVECVMITQQWYAENMPYYKAALEGKTSIMPGGEDVIADHRRGVIDKGKPKIDDGKDKGADGEWRHADYLVARLMAEAASRVEAEPAAGVSIAPDLATYRTEPRRSAPPGRRLPTRRVGAVLPPHAAYPPPSTL
jgi:phage FluMu gp28-like protein